MKLQKVKSLHGVLRLALAHREAGPLALILVQSHICLNNDNENDSCIKYVVIVAIEFMIVHLNQNFLSCREIALLERF